MISCIEYNHISSLTLEETLERLIHSEKLKIGDACIDDFAINGSVGSMKINEFNYRSHFGYGVYVLFDNNEPVYVGMTADNFFHRILSHCNTNLQPFWGWNALLKKIASKLSNGKDQNKLTDTELKAAAEKLKTFQLARINVLIEAWNKPDCKKLEKLLMRGFKYKGYELYNTRFGHLNQTDLNKSLDRLMSKNII